MSKWSFFYLIIPIFGVAAFGLAPYYGWDLPENISTLGRDIDQLYYLILGITGVTFVATQAMLVYILYRFSGTSTRERRSLYTHGNRMLEIWWTMIPAAVLLFIALFQMNTWVEARFPEFKPNVPPLARVLARQFEWRIIYPGPDGQLDTVDDIHVPNELHVPMNRRVLLQLRSMDVLHSFFLPHLRVKQDAVPGLSIPVWFDATKSTRQFQADHANYEAKDFQDLGRVAVMIRNDKSPLATYLRGELTEETAQQLDEYDEQVLLDGTEPVSKSLIDDLNSMIKGDVIYTQERFAGVQLAPETAEHVQDLSTRQGAVIPALLNRQLLDDAFGDRVFKLNRHYDLVCAELCGWGHYKMKGRLVVHETQEELDAWLARKYAEQEAAR